MIDRLSEGYEPRFDLDAAVGRQGELFCNDIAHGISDGSIEVKTDERSLSTRRVYVEYECRGKPSGIQTTHSEFWAFALGRPTSVLVAAPVLSIRAAARRAWKDGYRAECNRGSHPTKGALIPLEVLVQWCLDLAEKPAA